MSESNGKPSVSPYRRAAERHRAERSAWDRVRAARIELAAAVADYELFWQGCPLPPGRPLLGGIAELPDDERDDAAIIAGLQPEPVNGLVELPAAEFLGLTEAASESLERILVAESDADAAAAAELPGGDWSANRPVVDPPPKRERKKKEKPSLTEAMQPAADAALDRLGQMLDSQDQSRNLSSQKPDFEAGLEQATTDGLPPWTSEDLEAELLHAIRNTAWRDLVANGATIEQIANVLEGFWPRHGRQIVPREVSGGKLGYTFNFAGGVPYFWLGINSGVGRKATLYGSQLIDRIRSILEIPTPTQARKAAQFSFRDIAVKQGIPMNPPPSVSQSHPGGPRFIQKPAAGWDEAELRNAAEDLHSDFRDLAVCDKCQSARNRTVHPCPKCKSPNYRLTDSDAVWGAPALEPPKRGRGRPPGSKTRKAVEA